MRVVIEKSGKVIGLDKIASSILRTDLTPVPVSFEFTVKLDEELKNQLVKGAVLLVSDNEVSLTIVKKIELNTQMVLDDQRVSIASFIAVLTGCESLIDPLENAIILSDTSFAQAYRAAGCRLKFDKDIPLSAYIAPFGSWATKALAAYFQEEAALPFFKNGRMNVQRISKFFEAEATLIDASAVAWISNPTVENKVLSNYVSVAEDGAMVQGTSSNKTSHYYPDADARILKNLNTVLVTRGTVTRSIDTSINAGDIFLINDKKYIVLTAAHQFNSGALGGGTNQASRYWICEVNHG